MHLPLPLDQISEYAKKYEAEMRSRDQKLTTTITQEVFPSFRQKGYLTKEEFLTVCAWKTPRSKPLCEANDESMIREISQLALSTNSEELRIRSWTLLSGVKWPTASVFLHFAFDDLYPILDFRAIWSLGIAQPSTYTFPFWKDYVSRCRDLAKKAGVSMRVLDEALWKYSDLNQKTTGTEPEN